MSVLDFVRTREPELVQIPDDELLDFIARKEPEFLTDPEFQAEIRGAFGRKANQDAAREELRTSLNEEPNPFLGTAFGRAVTRGAGQVLSGVSSGFSAAQALRQQLGLEPDPTIAAVAPMARAFATGAAELPTEGPETLRDIRSTSDLGAFILERGVGEQLPQLALSGATAGVGALAGLTPKAASILGALSTTFPLETGGAFEEIQQRTGKDAPFTAAAVGAVNAFLETFGDSKLIERALGGDQLVGRTVSGILGELAKRTATQGAREAGTEAAQELVTALAPMTEGAAAPTDLGERLSTAAVLGGTGGTAISAGIDVGQLGTDAVQAQIPTQRDLMIRRLLADQAQFSPMPGVQLFREEQISGPGTTRFLVPPPATEGAPPVLFTPIVPTQNIPSSLTPEEFASIPGVGFTPWVPTQNIPSSATPTELTSIPGIGFDRRRELAVRPANLEEPPLLDPGIQLEPTLGVQAAIATQQIRNERERRRVENMTREQQVAFELLQRMDEERTTSLAEAQALEEQGQPDMAILRFGQGLANRIDALVALRSRPRAPLLQTDQGLTTAPSTVDLTTIPIIESPSVPTEVATQGPAAGAVAPAATPTDTAAIETPAPPQETQRQAGSRFTLNLSSPARQRAMASIEAAPVEEHAEAQKVDAEGLPIGKPTTSEGQLLQQLLGASAIVRRQARAQGVELDAEAEANLERRFQDYALNQYEKAQAEGKPFKFNRKTAFKYALADTAKMRNTAGQLRGRVVSTEVETDEGTTIVRSEVEEQAQPEDEDPRATGVLNFLDQFPTQNERSAAMNLLADALGLPRQFNNPSPQRVRHEKDPKLQALVAEFAPTIDRNSLGEVVGTPLSVADVQAVVDQTLTDTSLVQVINDPTLTTPSGQPIRGQFRPGQPQPIVLNAAFLGSAKDVQAVLYEELMHQVWADPAVQAEWQRVIGSLTEQDLQTVQAYPQEEQQEEAAIRKVLASVGEPQGFFQRLLDAVIGAIQRLFGVNTTRRDAQRILQRALASRSGVGPVRNSLAQGLWRNLQDAQKDADKAGDPGTILGSAAAQGTIIPQSYIQTIEGLGTTGEQAVARRFLNPVVDVAEMGRQLANNLGPAGVTLGSGMTLAPANGQDIAAEAIVKQSLRLQALRDGAEKRGDEASNELADALGRIPEAIIAKNDADLYRGLSDQMADDYSQYLKDQMVTLKTGTFDSATEQEINAASRRVTEDYRGIGNAVASTLRAVAKEIPPTELASAPQARAWITTRLNDPTLPRIVSDSARDWLLSPIGRRKSPLERDERIHLRLAAVQKLAQDDAATKANMLAFQKGFSPGGKKVSSKQFAIKFSALRQKHADAIAIFREISSTIKRLDDKVKGMDISKGILDQLLADPAYQAPVKEAVAFSQAGSPIRRYEQTNGVYTGKILYENPLNGETVSLDLRPDVKTDEENTQKIATLLRDVQTWMGTTDNQVLRAAWDKEADWIQTFAFGIAPGLKTGNFIGGYRVPSFLQWNPFGRELWLGNLETPGPTYQRIGGRVVQGAHQAGILADQVDKEIRIITDEFKRRIGETAAAAAASHGWPASDVAERWVTDVLEPIVSQYQNPTAKPYAVGEEIAPGIKVTKEDMAAAKALKDRDVRIFDALQKAGLKSSTPLLYFNPLQTEEMVSGKPLSRRSVDYGLKMPRRPLSRQNERGRVFTEKWVSSKNGLEKRSLLEGAYDWVLMSNGLIGNTDKEFSPTIATQDQALFEKIRTMQRAGTLPFSDLDGLIQWAGTELATPTLPEAQAAAEFELRLLGYVDSFINSFNSAMKVVPKTAKNFFEKLNLPPGIVDSVGVGESPFVTPRGRLAAPPSFYRYTAVDGPAWGAITAGIRSVMTLREIEAINAAKVAIDREVERFESKSDGEIVKLQKQLRTQGKVRVGPFSARRRIARSSLKQADAGELMYDYNTLKNHQRSINALKIQLERIAKEHVTFPDDNETIQFIRGGRQTLISSLLQSIVSVANNVFGGVVTNTMYRRALGSWRFVTTPFEMLHQGAKYITGNIISKLRRIRGVDPAVQALLKTPGIRKAVEFLVEQQLSYEQERIRAEMARTVDPQAPADQAALARLYPETYGRITPDDPGPIIGLFNQIVSRTPGLSRTLETGKAVFPGAFDRMINQLTTTLAGGWSERLTQKALEAWQARDTGLAGWDDLSLPVNRFGHKELGLPSATPLAFWRNMLSPIGSLEALSLDHYKRTKAGYQGPMLNDAQVQQIAQEIGRATNIGGTLSTPAGFRGRGLSGEIRKFLTMFMRYPVNFAAVQENVSGRTFGDIDSDAKKWRAMSTIVVALLVALLTAIGSEFGQAGRELVTGDPKTRRSIVEIAQDPSFSELVRYTGTSLSSIFPFIGERITQAFGGTSNKPLLDATRMFVPLNVAAEIEKTAIQIMQSGDMAYPMADLIRRFVPMSGIALNRLIPGEVEAKEASRGLRLAAPADMEVRQFSGGSTSRQTPQTPLIREAVNKAVAGDLQGSQAALEEAIRLRVADGQSENEARSSVASAFQSRDPERTVFGRQLTQDERKRVTGRMSASQRRSFNAARKAFDRTLLPKKGRTRRRRGSRISSRRRNRRRSYV